MLNLDNYLLVKKLEISMQHHQIDLYQVNSNFEERGDSVVECLTRDQGVAGSSLTRGISLCSLARHFILCLVLVQLRKTCPDMT